ncbi:MAG: IreB family regulatory phosphoprotein [Firmicutes bacterium]|nr:IreB family regulatory phosphoprotein [Bacillota bacterium]
MSEQDMKGTQYFKIISEPEESVRDVLIDVYKALQIKGYNPINQMVGYIMSEDPTYITSYNGSRGKIARIDRDEIIEELVRSFVEYHKLEKPRNPEN